MLKLNVGISRKVGQPNYGSRGAAVSLEAEVESALTGNPAALQQRIHALFRVADAAVVAELSDCTQNHGQKTDGNHSNNTDGAHHAEHSDQHNNQQNSRLNPRLEQHPQSAQPTNKRPATASQCRAIHAISSQLPLDLSDELRIRFGAAAPGELSLLEASEFIDWLKSQSDYNESINS